MILHTFDIPLKTRTKDGPSLIMPVGDIQWAGEGSDVAIKMLARHIQWGVDNNAYFLGMGDYVDTFSPSNREALHEAKIYSTGKNFIDKSAKSLVRELYDIALAPSKGRWLGLLQGHHFHRYGSGQTTDQDLCELLDTRFLGTSAIVRLRFGANLSKSKGGGPAPGYVQVWCHHGKGHGKRVAAPLNVIDHLPTYFPECSIFFIGHHHKKVGAPLDQMIVAWPIHTDNQEPKLFHRTCIIAGTGGFLKGYIEGREQGTYVEQAMLPPVTLGGVLVRITPRWVLKGDGKTQIWLPDLSVEQ